ncbi:hypothetical protein GQ600_7925 [Phytophthora cactorum]|nr:hypothetical protein GQ600_7925 [Phytophthora cactorum]
MDAVDLIECYSDRLEQAYDLVFLDNISGILSGLKLCSDDQALLDILLMTEPDGPKDVDMQDVFTPLPAPQTLPQVQQEVQPTSPVVVHAKKQTAKDSPKGKLSAMERRARHREAALNSLRDTVKELEEQLEKLSMSKQKQTDNAAPKSKPTDEIQRRYALLTNEQEELGNEAARLRLLLNYRQQFATNMVTLAQRAVSISSDDSDHSDTDSDTATTSSTASLIGAMSPSSSPMCFDTDSPLAMHDVSPLNATQKTKTPFYNEPRPTFVGPTITGKTPLAMAMRKQLGYKPLSFSESSTLVNEMYRCILSFSLNGKAISTGASIMGWEDKRRDGKPVQWTELQGWFVFEPTADGDGAQVEYGGCMDYGDHESVATLAMNTLSIVFKWETPPDAHSSSTDSSPASPVSTAAKTTLEPVSRPNKTSVKHPVTLDDVERRIVQMTPNLPPDTKRRMAKAEFKRLKHCEIVRQSRRKGLRQVNDELETELNSMLTAYRREHDWMQFDERSLRDVLFKKFVHSIYEVRGLRRENSELKDQFLIYDALGEQLQRLQDDFQIPRQLGTRTSIGTIHFQELTVAEARGIDRLPPTGDVLLRDYEQSRDWRGGEDYGLDSTSA